MNYNKYDNNPSRFISDTLTRGLEIPQARLSFEPWRVSTAAPTPRILHRRPVGTRTAGDVGVTPLRNHSDVGASQASSALSGARSNACLSFSFFLFLFKRV